MKPTIRTYACVIELGVCCVAAGCGSDGMSGVPSRSSPRAALSIAAAHHFTCALTVDGTAYCWGLNSNGQLGNGSIDSSNVPVLVSTSTRFSAIAAADRSVCALSIGGDVWCWGQVPGQSSGASPTPVEQVAAAQPLRSIVVGSEFACGLDANGTAYCWGVNHNGQLGVGDTTARATPTPVAGALEFTELSAGFWHTCGIASAGAAYCWGDNSFGESGGGPAVSRVLVPTAVGTPEPLSSIDAGAVLACGIAASGSAYCWGGNASAQLGDGTTTTRFTPTLVAGGISFATIRAARNNQSTGHTCGIARDGTAYCWGYDTHGQTGTLATDSCAGDGLPSAVACTRSPTIVAGLGDAVAIDAGVVHSCAISSTGTMRCWGFNAEGELGDGTNTERPTPRPISGSLVFPSR